MSAPHTHATPGDPPQDEDHAFLPVAGHPDDDECTHRADGTDATYCGRPRAWHEHHPRCYQNTGTPDDLPDDLCDCRVLRMIDAAKIPAPASADTEGVRCDASENDDGTPHLAYFRDGVSFVWSGFWHRPIQVCPGGYGEPATDAIPVDRARWLLGDPADAAAHLKALADEWLELHR